MREKALARIQQIADQGDNIAGIEQEVEPAPTRGRGSSVMSARVGLGNSTTQPGTSQLTTQMSSEQLPTAPRPGSKEAKNRAMCKAYGVTQQQMKPEPRRRR